MLHPSSTRPTPAQGLQDPRPGAFPPSASLLLCLSSFCPSCGAEQKSHCRRARGAEWHNLISKMPVSHSRKCPAWILIQLWTWQVFSVTLPFSPTAVEAAQVFLRCFFYKENRMAQ